MLATLDERTAANLAELAQTNHVIDAAITLDIDRDGHTIVRCCDFGDRNFTILHILALVDARLIFTVQVTKVDTAVN